MCVPNFFFNHVLEFYTQINLNYIRRFSLYSAVKTRRLKVPLPLRSSPAERSSHLLRGGSLNRTHCLCGHFLSELR